MFKINHLDHVAIYVADMEKSAAWYEKTLGLKKYKVKKWGDFPIFMLAGKCGVAIFPADVSLPPIGRSYKGAKIDHFAFNVDRSEFEKAKAHYENIGVKYIFRDHHYFHSIYAIDPDGHTVELTTLVVEEKDFY